MPRFEYKVVPAPAKGQKAKGVKTQEGRFALAIETSLNALALEGWEYVRAELLPSDERSGLTGSTVNWRNVLIFRRELETETDALDARPVAVAPAPQIAPIAGDPGMIPAEPVLETPTPQAEDTAHLSLVHDETPALQEPNADKDFNIFDEDDTRR